eukprot:CAMPEP_0196736000 /NCGR_PEP_ID=MMETSP1091-20130531/14212_1 /TAXON_ID=302021 /ORGANISM="Rhodomonas sp., Strain CCMP768" /LENGTH=53 /DNA_ID=CAMNT_0042079687 /DNA_START=30 /DNA_END=187 /DNA_ORIENTATION=-
MHTAFSRPSSAAASERGLLDGRGVEAALADHPPPGPSLAREGSVLGRFSRTLS